MEANLHVNSVLQMSFSQALIALNHGKSIYRASSPDRKLIYVPGSVVVVQGGRPLAAVATPGTQVNCHSHIDVYNSTFSCVRVWSPTQEEILAEDWMVVESLLQQNRV